jgi:hypothetical protein
LKGVPIVLSVGPNPQDLVFDFGRRLQAKIYRPLSLGIFDTIQNIRGKGGPFDADARKVHEKV